MEKDKPVEPLSIPWKKKAVALHIITVTEKTLNPFKIRHLQDLKRKIFGKILY